MQYCLRRDGNCLLLLWEVLFAGLVLILHLHPELGAICLMTRPVVSIAI